MTISSNYFEHVFKKWATYRYFLRKLVIKLHMWLQKVFTSEILPVVFFNIKIGTNYVWNVSITCVENYCDVINYSHVENNLSNSMNSTRIQNGKTHF